MRGVIELIKKVLAKDICDECLEHDNKEMIQGYMNNVYKGMISDINYDKTEKVLSFSISNKSEANLYFGMVFTIEEYMGNYNWKDTGFTDDLAFIEIVNEVIAGQRVEDAINIEQIGTSIKEGIYRIRKNYFNDNEEIECYIQFDVNDNEEFSNFKTYNQYLWKK